jgi:hypothetical protein
MNSIRAYFKRCRDRKAEIAMLYIGLHSNFWHPINTIFVLTGLVWK